MPVLNGPDMAYCMFLHDVGQVAAFARVVRSGMVPGPIDVHVKIDTGMHRLGITMRVHSPTFNLVNIYTGGRLTLYHIDLYRLEGDRRILQAATLAFDDITALVMRYRG